MAVEAIVAILTECVGNFESPCHPSAFHQVLTQSDAIREQMRVEDFHDGHLGAISDIKPELS